MDDRLRSLDMYVDWVTWSIWLIGFVILVVWIYMPLKEFRRLLALRKGKRLK